MSKRPEAASQYAPLSRSDVMARCILLPMVLVIAVVGLLLGGQQDMVQLFGTILGALVLAGTLSFARSASR